MTYFQCLPSYLWPFSTDARVTKGADVKSSYVNDVCAKDISARNIYARNISDGNSLFAGGVCINDTGTEGACIGGICTGDICIDHSGVIKYLEIYPQFFKISEVELFGINQ